MAVLKRIQKNGSIRSFLLTQDFLANLGFKPDELGEAYVRVELVKGALVVTRADAPVMSTDDLKEALVEVERRRGNAVALKPNAGVKLTGPRLKLCQAFWEEGPMRPTTVIQKLGIDSRAVYAQLTRARQEGLLVKDGVAYSLNPAIFDV